MKAEFDAMVRDNQMTKVLLGMDDYTFVKTEKDIYADCRGTQEKVLLEMLKANADTEYGRKYNFAGIKSVEEYQAKVPVTDWEDYIEYSQRMQRGEENVTFPGKATFFYRTSGTTSSYKLIPESVRERVSRGMISRGRITEMILHLGPEVQERVFAFFNKSALDMTEGGIPYGTASGRSSENTSPDMVKKLTYPPQLVNEFEGDELKYMMLRFSLCYDNVSAILGNNALMLRTLIDFGKAHAEDLINDIRRGVSKYPVSEKLKAAVGDLMDPDPDRADELEKLYKEDKFIPKYYWKKLRAAAFWLGGSVGVYVKNIKNLLPDTTQYYDVGYGASEGKINIPILPGTPAGVLATMCNFYEFIPEEGGAPITADKLEQGKNYDLIITNNAGLYRYDLKDLIHVDSFTGNTPNIYFLSKLADVANLAQEKIPGVMLIEAITDIMREEKIEFKMAQVFPDPETQSYIVCLEPSDESAINAENYEALKEKLDSGLRSRLIQYDTYRGKLLNKTGLAVMKTGWADEMIKKYTRGNATSAQVKVPVVANKMPVIVS